MDDYITAERRGRDTLRRFLLDLDAKEANQVEWQRSLGAVLELYLQADAHPRNEGGLAPSTYRRYESIINVHLLGRPREQGRAPRRYARVVATVPAVRFNGPQAPRAWHEQMLREGVPQKTSEQAWHGLSAALTWAASLQLVEEIQVNGCRLASEPRSKKRRSQREGGTGYAPARRRHGEQVADWALAPRAVEAIRAQILRRTHRRSEILGRRDAMVVSLQYGLCLRNQKVWGLRWSSLIDEFAWVLEVLSCGELSDWGKTEHSTHRRTAIPGLLREDLAEWRACLLQAGRSVREHDFIIPGDLTGAKHGTRDPRTGACHLSESQAHNWGKRFSAPAVEQVAQRDEFFSSDALAWQRCVETPPLAQVRYVRTAVEVDRTLVKRSSGDSTPRTAAQADSRAKALPGGGICPSLLTPIISC
jgi:hypothetical protein